MENVRPAEQTFAARTEVLIAIGAATAANCIPCFEHLYEKALEVGLTHDEIKKAADLAAQVKKGAHLALTNSINEIIGVEEQHDLPCSEAADRSCCG